MRRMLWVIVLASGLTMAASMAWAESAESESLKGPAFSDPSEVQEMPEGWAEQLIEYEPGAADADLVVNLNQHFYPALVPLIEEFARKRGLKIAVSDGTCGTAAGRLSSKSVDMAGFCCPPGDFDRLPGLEFHTLGVEPVALIVNHDNPVDNISLIDARRIFQGLVYNWKEVGSRDITVQPVGRLHCKLRAGHWRLLLDNEDLFSPRLVEVTSIPEMIRLVATNPKAIGYEAIQMVRQYGDGNVKMLRVDGFDPVDLANLESGEYPFYRVMNITTWKGKDLEKAAADELVEYLLERVGSIDKKYGIVPASRLRESGWKFKGDELVGEPDRHNGR